MALLPLLAAPLAGKAIGALGRLFGGKKKPNPNDVALERLDKEYEGATAGERQFRDDSEGRYEGAIGDWNRDTDAFGARGSELEGYEPTRFDPTDLEGYQPDRLNGFDPRSVRDFDPAELRGYDSGLDEYEDPGAVAGDLDALRQRRSEARGFKTTGFDAGEAVKAYAAGAWSDAERSLKRNLAGLEEGQAGSGRLRSGFFDEDRGDVITEVGRGYTSDVAKQAVNAAGITQQAIAARDQAELGRASQIDRAELTALETAASQGSAAAQRRLSALTEGARLRFGRAEGIDRTRQQAGERGAELELEAGVQGGRLGLERATALTTSRQRGQEFGDTTRVDAGRAVDDYRINQGRTVLDSRSGMAKLRADRAESARDRYPEMLVGGINRRLGERNAQRQSRDSRTSGILGLGGKLIETLGPSVLKRFGGKG